MILRPGAGAGVALVRLLARLLHLAGTRLAELRLDGPGPGAPPAPPAPAAAVVVVAAVRADLLLVQALSLPKLGSAVLKPDLQM